MYSFPTLLMLFGSISLWTALSSFALPISGSCCHINSNLSVSVHVPQIQPCVTSLHVLERRAGSATRNRKKNSRPSNQRKPTVQKPEHRIEFADSVNHKFKTLGLKGHDLKTVKKFHEDVIGKHMQKIGATKGKITHEAHGKGSVDSNVHITAQFSKTRTTKAGGTVDHDVPSMWRGQERKNHHVYVNDKAKEKGVVRLPHAWKQAVTKHQQRMNPGKPVQFKR